MNKEVESRYNGQPFLSFSVTFRADSCYAGILRFVLVVVVMVEVVVPLCTTTSTITSTTNINHRIQHNSCQL